MKIYNFDPSSVGSAWSGQGGVPVADAYTLINSEIIDVLVTNMESPTCTMQIEQEADGFNASGDYVEVAGDNVPTTNVDPVAVPIAVKGDYAVFADTNLNVAEEELINYEYIKYDSNAYLIWGELNVSKTDFYTPVSESKGAVYLSMDANPTNF